MNPDNFEKQLERLAWRPAPAEWRQEILDAACPRQKNLAAAIDPRPAASGWWRLPFPWLAFAGLWVFLLASNALLALSNRTASASTGAIANTTGLPTVWNLQLAELRQSGLDAATDPIRIVLPPAGKPSPRPRSDRRRLLRLGCLDEGSEGALRA
jgi:hypothetical protein